VQHYCDEVSQGISQATSDARTLHDSVARLAAQCAPHDLSPPPAAAAVAPATAAAIEQAEVVSKASTPSVVAYSDHSAGNIYHRHNSNGSAQKQPQLARVQSPNAN
jgi:hypothetical protein